jgi:hypothetical protein
MLLQFTCKSVDFFMLAASDLSRSINGTPEESAAQERSLPTRDRCCGPGTDAWRRSPSKEGRVQLGLGIMLPKGGLCQTQMTQRAMSIRRACSRA